MKLFYVTAARIPTEKAHGIQIIKMCEAFQGQGIEVELLLPFRLQSPAMKSVDDLWTHYDVENTFCIRYLPSPDTITLAQNWPAAIGRALYFLQCVIFAFLALLRTIFQQGGMYYTRHVQVLLVLCATQFIHRKAIYFEAHEFHGARKAQNVFSWVNTALMQWMLRKIDGLVVITHRLKALYTSLGIPGEKVLVAPDGVARKRLGPVCPLQEARKELQLPLDKKIICYTGHLFQWKGVYTLAESSRHLPKSMMICIVGGIEKDRKALLEFISAKQLTQVVITGYVPYHKVPFYLAAADILALPNSATARIAREYTSPLKLFEYMGAQRPIVASDLPSLREVLRHRENALLVQPDNPEAFAEGVLELLHDRQLMDSLTNTAYEDVQEYTWEKRAGAIRAYIETNRGAEAC